MTRTYDDRGAAERARLNHEVRASCPRCRLYLAGLTQDEHNAAMHPQPRYFGIYRERARSAVLATIMPDRERAIAHAEMLSNTGYGPHLVAAYDTGGTDWTRAHQDVIRYNDPTAPRYIHRAGDWDSRSAWQPYPAPKGR